MAATRSVLDALAAEKTEAATAGAKRTRARSFESLVLSSHERLCSAETSQHSAELDEAWSARSNPSVSSGTSSIRERHRQAIASAFFGSRSNVTEAIVESPRTPSGGRGRRRQRQSRCRRVDGRREKQFLRRFFRPRRASESALAVVHVEARALPAEHVRRVKTQVSVPLDSIERDEERWQRRENRLLFDELVHLANTHQPVEFGRFKQRRSLRGSSRVERRSGMSSGQLQRSAMAEALDVGVSCSTSSRQAAGGEESRYDGDARINTELLEAYIAYSKSIGHEPKLQLHPDMLPLEPRDALDEEVHDEEGDKERQHVRRASFIHDRPVLTEQQHFWTGFLGTRYSKRRGCVQFWTWLLIGVGVLLWLGISLSSLEMNEVLHLDAFTLQDVHVTDDYAFLHFLDEVDFHLTYTIETPLPSNSTARRSALSFNALLLLEDEYEHYIRGEAFTYVDAGTTLRTTSAHLSLTLIDNPLQERMYFVLQPCVLARNPSADYCQAARLPTSVYSREKIYELPKQSTLATQVHDARFVATYVYVNPIPVACSSSGWLGGTYLLLFLPYVVITLFGLRGFQMLVHCESWQQNLERNYARELQTPEHEVDYWQPMPWDRKVAKTRLCGPCCWTKFRRPLEPFHTWWRHENYFTWVFCPYRNEQLSRGERALIVVCSLYITFYVLFIIVMLRDSWGTDMTLFTSVVLYAILLAILPPAGKAVFKELFKLIFRQRRKYFRAKATATATATIPATGGPLQGFSFRLAFVLQFLVVLLLTLAQGPIFYIWTFRSCLFLKQFMWFGALAAIMRMSLVALALDLMWYLIIQTWGWKDLCPYCTERIKHCDCFNDELLVLAVERVGPKWQLIRVLDDLMAKQCHYDPQFELYTAEQLRERWDVLVDRAKSHMAKIEKLRAYQENKRLERLRYDRVRRSVTSFLSFRGGAALSHRSGSELHVQSNRMSCNDMSVASGSEDALHEGHVGAAAMAMDVQVCSLREQKILALTNDIKLDKFEKHYDSNISSVFHVLTCSVQILRRQGKHEVKTRRLLKERSYVHNREDEDEAVSSGNNNEEEEEEEAEGDDEAVRGSRSETGGASSGRGTIGETMWVLDTPAQRLERREEEKLRRKQAFRVLNKYKIESVDHNTSEPRDMLSPIRSRHSAVSALSNGRSSPMMSHGRQQHEAMMRPLLLPSDVPTSLPRETLVTLVLEKEPGEQGEDVERGQYDERIATGGLNVSDTNDNDGDAYLSDVERGIPHAALDHRPPPSSRTCVYSVTERPQTLLRRLSASASVFTAWALNYDPDVDY